MEKDIGNILNDWPYDQDDDLPVRIIRGKNGNKLQMRIDMGIIQMELDGNPSGENPEGFETWFDYYQRKKKEFEDSEINDFFILSEEDCVKLRRESTNFYHRYLSLMKLCDYKRVVRDTGRNLKVFSFMKKYASTEMDRWSLDQYRPYVIMMNSRANASLEIEKDTENGIRKGISHLENGITGIVDFYTEYGMESEMENSFELSLLKALREEFLKSAPQTLEDKLADAVREERFEDAVKIRDELRKKGK